MLIDLDWSNHFLKYDKFCLINVLRFINGENLEVRRNCKDRYIYEMSLLQIALMSPLHDLYMHVLHTKSAPNGGLLFNSMTGTTIHRMPLCTLLAARIFMKIKRFQAAIKKASICLETCESYKVEARRCFLKPF